MTWYEFYHMLPGDKNFTHMMNYVSYDMKQKNYYKYEKKLYEKNLNFYKIISGDIRWYHTLGSVSRYYL